MELGMLLIKLPNYTLVDMFQLLSQVKLYVPFLEMMRIDEHKQKEIALINGANIACDGLVVHVRSQKHRF